MNTPSTIKIDNVEYIRADQVPATAPNGNRAVIVIDRGWIFAGDIERYENDLGQDRIKITRAVWVFRWESCGFSRIIEDPFKADIRAMADVDIPAGAEIFCVPVHDQWGLK